MLQRKPAWYRPVQLDGPALDQVRRETANLADEFGDRLVAGRPFEFILTEEQLGRWVAASDSLWPNLMLPREVTRPAVKLLDGRAIIAAHLESKGWRIVLSAELEPTVSETGQLQIRLHEVCGGAISIPKRFLSRALSPKVSDADGNHGSHAASDTVDLSRLLTGMPIENRFVWPNGERPFRIAALAISNGELRLKIEPRR